MKKVNGPNSPQKVERAAQESGKRYCRNLPRKTKQYSFKKVPRAPPSTWPYGVRPAPKAPDSLVSLGQGLPALPAQELQGPSGDGPARSVVAFSGAKEVVARGMARTGSGTGLLSKPPSPRPGRRHTRRGRASKSGDG